MTYDVVLSPAAARELRKLDPPVRRRIQAVLELLAENPGPPAATRLVGGTGEWRVRTGDYRVIYEIEDDRLVVLVLRAGHRGAVYRKR
ncbi:type II toxin-antitoxin system RelE family toxin [Georgenia subflava]|uniref:Plasmid stabilization protein n=1 Tax=Georgenia subflava TaxID=1622177 RepID=A0A6N7EH31_9MICO|nr:type II toxin-antitoxin system RelE/ParE family toxin [Georgenia subflava]MPV36288.1 plasmid stabilization protein [Georgenia subflava]